MVRIFRRRKLIRWLNPLGGLVIAVAAWFILPGLLPLVVFGLLVSLFGEGLVGFTLSITGGVAVSLLYPALFGTVSYNAGHGPVGFTQLIMLQMDSVIVGLLFLNAFFLLAFKNRYFQEYALPMIRARLRTAASRLGWGLGLAAVNFCDDLAAGGILNRLYENDIKSPGVSEAIKRRMLIMVLLLANAFPAFIPWQSWTPFYRMAVANSQPGQSLYILLPLPFICISF